MAHATIEGSQGLVTAVSPAAAPPGSLVQAYGLVCSRPGLLQKQRPFRQYAYGGDSNFADPGSAVKTGSAGIAYLNGRLFVVDSTGSLFQENAIDGGVFTGLGVLASGTSPFGFRISEAIKNGYIAGIGNTNFNLAHSANAAPSCGMLCIDSFSSNPREVGTSRVPDLSLTEVASGSLLLTGQSRAYRACAYFSDKNGNVVRGSPSGRAVLTASASTKDILIKMYLSQQALRGTAVPLRWEIYATKVFATGTVPDEEYQLIADLYITSTDYSNGYATFTDIVPDAMRAATLYTSPSQGGLLGANEQPPIGWDSVWFKQFMLVANTTQKYRAISQVLSYPELWAIQSIVANSPAAGQSTYTFLAGVDLTGFDNTFKLAVINSTTNSNDGTWAIADVNTGGFTHGVDNTNHKVVVTNAGVAQAGVAGSAMSGQLVVGNLTYFPIFAAESVANRYFTVPSTGTVSAVVQSMCASLLRVVNQQNGVITGSSTSTIVGYNMSGDADAPGKILWEEVGIGRGSAFTVYAKGTTTTSYANAYSNKFAPTMTSAVPLTATNDARSNRVHYSKYGEPEHFPLVNFLDIGSSRHQILRMTALRNAVLVWKEDGLFRITSDGTNLYWSVVDPTQVLLGSALVCTIQNQACAVTSRGPWLFTESSAHYIGASVQNLLDRVCAPYSNTTSGMGRDLFSNAISRVSASPNDGLVYFYFNKAFTVSATDSLGLVYSLNSGIWTHQWSNATGYASTSIDGVVGQVKFDELAFCEINGTRFGIHSNATNSTYDIYCEDQYALTGSIFREYPWSGLKNVEAAAPVPGHKYLIDHLGGNATPSDPQLLMKSLGGPALAAGILINMNLLGGGVYKLTTPHAVVGSRQWWSMVPVIGPDVAAAIAAAAAGRTFVYAPQPAQWEYHKFSADNDAIEKAWTELRLLFDDLSTVSANSISVITWTETTTPAAATAVVVPPAVPSALARVGVEGKSQSGRRLSVRCSHSNPLEYLFIRGIRYSYELLADDSADT